MTNSAATGSRWRIQFGLKRIILAILGIAIVLGCVRLFIINPRKEGQRVYTALEGQVTDLASHTHEPNLHDAVFGVNKAADVCLIDISRTRPDQSLFDLIIACPNLEQIAFTDCEVSDEQLSQLSCLSKLSGLALVHSNVSDSQIHALGAIKSLERVSLFDTNLTDQQAALLAKNPNIRELILQRTPLTDASVETFMRMPRLQHLCISQSKITVAAARKIAESGVDVDIVP